MKIKIHHTLADSKKFLANRNFDESLDDDGYAACVDYYGAEDSRAMLVWAKFKKEIHLEICVYSDCGGDIWEGFKEEVLAHVAEFAGVKLKDIAPVPYISGKKNSFCGRIF